MARNGSGTFSRPVSDYEYDTIISETSVNAEMDGIAVGLTNSLAKDGQTVPTANLPMGTYRHTGVGNGSARTDYAAMGQLQDSTPQWLGDSSGTNTVTASSTPAIAAYAAGQSFKFKAGGTNTGAVTLNLNGLGAKAVQKRGAALVAGDITTNNVVTIVYDGTQFQMISPTAVEAASTTVAGIVELANELETAVGTDTTRAVTPNSLNGKLPWGSTPGTADAIAVTYSPALTGLPDGQLCFFRAAAANTSTTPTFNPNGLGPKTIVKNGNQPLVAGDIAGQYHEIMLRYEGTNTRWELLNPAVPAATVAGRVKLVDNDWSTGTPSSVTFEDADGMDWSTYSYFEIELQGYITASCRLLCTFSQGGAYETGGTDYFYANTGQQLAASFSNGTSAIDIPNVSNQIYKGGSQYNEMFHLRASLYPGLSDATNIGGPYIHWSLVSSVTGTGNRGHANGSGSLRNLDAALIDGIKFEQNTGNMPNGSFKVWGIV